MPPDRPVDQAMDEDRLEKRAIRPLWVNEIRAVADQHPDRTEPWYLTLSGAEGRDIQLLIDAGLIRLEETGSIDDRDTGKVVAVENSMPAVARLQSKFPALRIKKVDFQSLLRGIGPSRWPEGKDETYCRARVVNIDLNQPLEADGSTGEVVFPVLDWIRKLCQLHARDPRLDWTLCLTLQGQISWPVEISQWIKGFLLENLGREPGFEAGCRALFGPELYANATGSATIDFGSLPWVQQQKLLLVLTPKLMAHIVYSDGWRVSAERCLRYGGGARAPMVTWIIRFVWDGAAAAAPDARYREALNRIFVGIGKVDRNGRIHWPCL